MIKEKNKSDLYDYKRKIKMRDKKEKTNTSDDKKTIIKSYCFDDAQEDLYPWLEKIEGLEDYFAYLKLLDNTLIKHHFSLNN